MKRQKLSKPIKRKPEYIAIEDLAHELGLLETDLHLWLSMDAPAFVYDHRNRPCVDLSFRDRYSHHIDYPNAFRNSLVAQIDESNDAKRHRNQHSQRRKKTIERYKNLIKELSRLHNKYLPALNNHDFESGVVAAYLLFGRAINLLNIGCLCLDKGFWYSGLILRDVDETLDVAQYFIITAGTEEGEKARHRWFRQNIAPKHAECRSKIAKWHASIDPDVEEENFRRLMNELYQKKSRWIHPIFSVIREVTGFKVNKEIHINRIDYGSSNFEHKLNELTHFFRSSIWTTFQSFMLCFKEAMPLNEGDVKYLVTQNRMFLRWESIDP
jgi:hypothetical protein